MMKPLTKVGYFAFKGLNFVKCGSKEEFIDSLENVAEKDLLEISNVLGNFLAKRKMEITLNLMKRKNNILLKEIHFQIFMNNIYASWMIRTQI